jgi:hypothetical protein
MKNPFMFRRTHENTLAAEKRRSHLEGIEFVLTTLRDCDGRIYYKPVTMGNHATVTHSFFLYDPGVNKPMVSVAE